MSPAPGSPLPALNGVLYSSTRLLPESATYRFPFDRPPSAPARTGCPPRARDVAARDSVVALVRKEVGLSKHYICRLRATDADTSFHPSTRLLWCRPRRDGDAAGPTSRRPRYRPPNSRRSRRPSLARRAAVGLSARAVSHLVARRSALVELQHPVVRLVGNVEIVDRVDREAHRKLQRRRIRILRPGPDHQVEQVRPHQRHRLRVLVTWLCCSDET